MDSGSSCQPVRCRGLSPKGPLHSFPASSAHHAPVSPPLESGLDLTPFHQEVKFQAITPFLKLSNVFLGH